MGPHRIAIAAQGTRGDFQPVLALGIGLTNAGHTIRFFADPGHCKMAQEFDLECSVISMDVKDVLASHRGMKAMEKGDMCLLGMAQKFDDEEESVLNGKDGKEWGKVFVDEVKAFKPDLLIWTSLVTGQVMGLKQVCPSLPCLLASYQPHIYATNHIGPILMQRLELEPDQPTMFRWVLDMQYQAMMSFQSCKEMQAKGFGDAVHPRATPHAVFERHFNLEEAESPFLMAYSPSWWPAYDDWPKGKMILTGNWKIRKEDQEAAAAKGGQMFNAGGQHQACVDFIEAGEKPVYIGWGSMMVFSKEHMARLAVGALKEANRRGIVVGGWAELSAESLGDDEGYADLKEFCKSHVLFLKSAPHEWLFRQCACCVHHGGIGTTQASLSSGVPTVVTPVFADQGDIAIKLTQDKHGLGTVHLSECTAKQLGEKIYRCCTDTEIINNCKELAEKMQKEDGVATTVEFIEKWMQDEVKSGNWKKKSEALLARLELFHEKFKDLNDPGPMFAKWNMDLADKYAEIKDYQEYQVETYGKMVGIFMQKKLWTVTAAGGCLTREGEGLKTPDCGRFKEFAMLEELEANKTGSRIRVRRIKGIGPKEGWISPVVSGKDIAAKVTKQAQIQEIGARSMLKQFADVVPPEVSKTDFDKL